MHDRMFPRWGMALFALLPLSEILYVRVGPQTMYAAALASLICALVCVCCVRLSRPFREIPFLRWVLAVFALWPLSRSVARMAVFLHRTVFTTRPLWSLVLLLTICALLTATSGLNRCAMWALPVAFVAGLVIVLSGVLTMGDIQPSYWQNPAPTLFTQMWSILDTLLPAGVTLAFSLPDSNLGGTASRGLAAGGALFALISLRGALLLGPHAASLFLYPNFSAAGLAAVGDFARHGEVFFAVPLILCEVGRAAALGSVLLAPFAQRAGKQVPDSGVGAKN